MSADRRLSRRSFGSVLAVATVSALATSGCDTDDGLDLPGLPDVAEEPDREQVLAALRDEQAVLDQLRRVQERHRPLRRRLEPVVEVHRAHVELLAQADDVGPDGTGEAGRVPGAPSDAVAQLVRLERSLSAQHVTTAMASRSGVLARVVASMSAAAAQQAVVLSALASEASPDPGAGATS